MLDTGSAQMREQKKTITEAPGSARELQTEY
jgi:hypothetical protein